MRHMKAGRRLGRKSAHRKAMYSNMVAALVTHGRIETTEAKAKELRSIADKTIHWGVGVSELVARGTRKLSDIERARVVHAKRMARRVLRDENALERLFAEIAPTFVGRPGGYTRVLKTRFRIGDAARMALVQLTGGAGQQVEAEPTEAAPARGKKEKAPKAEKADKAPKAEREKGKVKSQAEPKGAAKGRSRKGDS
jgi:large subunit ribosomal protein L17